LAIPAGTNEIPVQGDLSPCPLIGKKIKPLTKVFFFRWSKPKKRKEKNNFPRLNLSFRFFQSKAFGVKKLKKLIPEFGKLIPENVFSNNNKSQTPKVPFQ